MVGEASRDEWARGRRWEDLERRVSALNRSDERGEPLIPRSAAHDLREGVCLGEEVASARFGLLRSRAAGDREREGALMDLAEGEGGLFWPGHEGEPVTGLLDALAVLEFLPAAESAGKGVR
jgi:hypothetical protein